MTQIHIGGRRRTSGGNAPYRAQQHQHPFPNELMLEVECLKRKLDYKQECQQFKKAAMEWREKLWGGAPATPQLLTLARRALKTEELDGDDVVKAPRCGRVLLWDERGGHDSDRIL